MNSQILDDFDRVVADITAMKSRNSSTLESDVFNELTKLHNIDSLIPFYSGNREKLCERMRNLSTYPSS